MIQTRVLADGDPLRETAMLMIEAMHNAVLPLIATCPDTRDGISAVMTAASMLAGSQFGVLLVTGAVQQQDTRRAIDAAGRNFREGIKAGALRAARIEAETVGGTA